VHSPHWPAKELANAPWLQPARFGQQRFLDPRARLPCEPSAAPAQLPAANYNVPCLLSCHPARPALPALQGKTLEQTLQDALKLVPNPHDDPGITQLNRIRCAKMDAVRYRRRVLLLIHTCGQVQEHAAVLHARHGLGAWTSRCLCWMLVPAVPTLFFRLAPPPPLPAAGSRCISLPPTQQQSACRRWAAGAGSSSVAAPAFGTNGCAYQLPHALPRCRCRDPLLLSVRGGCCRFTHVP